ncbi:MAG: phosphoserine aminotransferase [Chlamydiales bacterium]|jgi:phosphoserine aminotransferase
MLTFNPGPSHLSKEIRKAIQKLGSSDLLSLSHRSKSFTAICQLALEGLRKNMHIPDDFRIFFQPSATVAMDTILRNVVHNDSFHFVHGAFSKRFHTTASEIALNAQSFESPWDNAVPWEKAEIPRSTELIAVTHNETSTGLMWPSQSLAALRKAHPTPLLALDLTSSFGAVHVNWQGADIWFGSVQKCLGLPSGLGFIIVNPRAFDKAKRQVLKSKGGVASWQRFDVLAENIAKFQTVETPNMFAIALLAERMQSWEIDKIQMETAFKASLVYKEQNLWRPYIKNNAWLSPTVMNLLVDDPVIFHQRAARKDYILGKGYGNLSDSCIRIANFPAIKRETLLSLLDALSNIGSNLLS